jgi:hypothetical protein
MKRLAEERKCRSFADGLKGQIDLRGQSLWYSVLGRRPKFDRRRTTQRSVCSFLLL